MIAYVGPSSEQFEEIFRVFRAGSKCDPLVGRALGPANTCHPDGWGFAIHDGGRLHHYRSSSPVWEDDISLPPLKGKTVCAILHSRFASNPALQSPICSHPFIAATDDHVLLLAHNGSIAIDDPSKNNSVDTEWALSVIADDGFEAALPRLKQQTRPNSALNLILMRIPRAQNRAPVIRGLNYYKTEERGRIDYYKMYTGKCAGGKIFMSSTFKDMGLPGLAGIEPAPFGEIFDLAANADEPRPENSRPAVQLRGT